MSKEPGTNAPAAPATRRYIALAGWTIAVNPDGSVGVVGQDGGDTAIKNAGKLEQRLLHALATALVEQQPGGQSSVFVSTRKEDGGPRFYPLCWQLSASDAELWNTLDAEGNPGARYSVVELKRGVIKVVLEGGTMIERAESAAADKAVRS